eukprot:jgi/Botrbrau1/16367/Bobra.0290s0002.1
MYLELFTAQGKNPAKVWKAKRLDGFRRVS